MNDANDYDASPVLVYNLFMDGRGRVATDGCGDSEASSIFSVGGSTSVPSEISTIRSREKKTL